MTPRRKNMVDKVFRMMDRDNSGQLNLKDISKSIYEFISEYSLNI